MPRTPSCGVTMVTILYRTLNHKERYYSIQLLPTLFGEALVIRSYGSVNNHKPTGEIRNVYETIQEAHSSVSVLLSKKYKRGYRLKGKPMTTGLEEEKERLC